MKEVFIILFCFLFCTCVSAQEVSYLPIKINTNRNVYHNEYSNSLSASISLKNNFLNSSLLKNINQDNIHTKEFQFSYDTILDSCKNHQWRNLSLYGVENSTNMIGLMDRQNVEIGIMYSHNKLHFSVGFMANVYNINPLSTRNTSPIQNQFGISGQLIYDFNDNVSATVYGRYVTNPFYHSMASFPYVLTSSFGGYLTLHNEKVGIDLGVNNYYDAFNRSWRTDPIVRPTYKLGKVKMSIDMGPLMKEGLLLLMNKRKIDGPIIMPSR